MDSVLSISIGVVQIVLLIAGILCLRRALYALEQIVEKIADIPTILSEFIPNNLDPTLVAEITALTQRMTNLEQFTDSRYKKMSAIDTRLGKHTREKEEAEDDGNLQIDYEALAQAVKSGQNSDPEPGPSKALTEAETIRLELGL